MSTDDADEDLMVLYQRGEVRAFEVLLSRHRKPVYNFILRFVGDKETAGQTVVIIEAMKTFNPIKAPKAGTVSQVLIDNARPVEFGEVLMILE